MVLGAAADSRMAISMVSFGCKFGAPVGMNIILDLRFIPNPFFVPELCPFDGTVPRVRDYVMAQLDAQTSIDETGRLLDFLIPLYRREGESYLREALGCTGGRHRSPVRAHAIADRLSPSGFDATMRDAHIAR